jgi:hypothetical protein
MLPPTLAQLKRTLEAKGYNQRTTGEDHLLEELTALDQVTKSTDLSQFSERITAGPSSSCPCCGR